MQGNSNRFRLKEGTPVEEQATSKSSLINQGLKSRLNESKRVDLLCSSGLALIWPLFQKACIEWALPLDSEARWLHIMIYFILGVALIFFALTACLIVKKSNRLNCLMKKEKGKVRLAFACTCLAGYWMVALGTEMDPLPSLWIGAGVILDAFGIAMLFYLWTTAIGAMTMNRLFYTLACSLAMGSALALAIDFLPYWVGIAVSSAFPICSMVALNLCLSQRKRERAEREPKEWLPKNRVALLATTISVSLVAALLVTGAIATAQDIFAPFLAIYQDVVSLITGCLLLLASYGNRYVNRYIRNLYLVAMLTLLVASFSFFLLRMDVVTAIAEAITRVASSILQYVLWAFVVKIEKDGTHLSKPPALFLGVLGLAWICERCISPLFEHFVVLETDLVIGLLASAFIIMLGCESYHRIKEAANEKEQCESGGVKGAQDNEDDLNLAKEKSIKEIKKRFRLSDREEEVLIYWVNGYSNKMIADKLVISTSTVSQHIKNIYRKTNVHKRDEAIKLVEDF